MKFGTDGIRGRAGSPPITAEGGLRVGRAAARLGKRVLIARDPRPSGTSLACAVAAGVAAAGGTAIQAGVLPTSGLAFALGAGLADAGVMLTASHNPEEDNGFKVFAAGGHKLDEEAQEAFEGWLTEEPSARAPGPVLEDAAGALAAYVAILEEATDPGALTGQRVAIDLAHGAATVLRPWLEAQPVEWVFVGAGDGAVNDGVGSEHLDTLRRAVLEHSCVAGVALDGDGDRCRIVDGRGRILPGDAVITWLARGRGVSGLAVTVMSTVALEGLLPGARVVRTAVGDRNLRHAMIAEDLALGGEESGHVLFSDLVAGDGLITGLRALALGDPAEANDAFVRLPRLKRKVAVRHRPALESLPTLRALQDRAQQRLGTGGRLFLRYSGTEPVLRILVEGEDEEAVAAVCADAVDVVTEELG